jgi:Fe-S cluster assembly protein SufD
VALPGLGGPALVFVNGRWAREAGTPGALPRGVRVEPLSSVLAADGAALEPHFGRLATFDAHAFTALNTALADEGVVVVLPPGAVVERPIEILFLSDARRGDAGIESHPRVLVMAGEASQATIVEVHAGGAGSFTNAVTEIHIAPAAGITHWSVQRSAADAFHLARLQAALERDSRFVSGTLQMGAALARNEVDVTFGAEGGDCQLDGLYVVGGEQHVDVRTSVDHAQPHCTSRQLYKGVLGDRAHGVFNGRVIVRKDAQKTSAHQTNRNVILSEQALVDTKPQLEIYADDVQCTHGATIGRLDEDALFYLRARGIGAAEAQALLVQAFVHEVVSRARPDVLEPGLDAALAPRLTALTSALRVTEGRPK